MTIPDIPNLLYALNPLHTQPDVIITGQEDQPDHGPLHFKKHRQLVSHHVRADGRVVITEFIGQEIPHEGEKTTGAPHADHIPYEPHPVVVRALFVPSCAPMYIYAATNPAMNPPNVTFPTSRWRFRGIQL